jgi:hypothetical protein
VVALSLLGSEWLADKWQAVIVAILVLSVVGLPDCELNVVIIGNPAGGRIS